MGRRMAELKEGERYCCWEVITKTNKISSSGQPYYICLCDCGTLRMVQRGHLISGRSKSCGCIQKKYPDPKIGYRHGRLVITNIIGRNNRHKYLVECICDCSAHLPDEQRPKKIYDYSKLANGHTSSCGCLQRESISKIGMSCKKENKYDLESFDFGIGYDSKGSTFIFDKEDFDYIKPYCWSVVFDNFNYYVKSAFPKNDKNRIEFGSKHITMHKYIMSIHKLLSDKIIDHINGNGTDNRKTNLRNVTFSQNTWNTRIKSNNVSGVKGVYFSKTTNKWTATLTAEGKKYNIPCSSFEEAVVARKELEQKYHGEYARR